MLMAFLPAALTFVALVALFVLIAGPIVLALFIVGAVLRLVFFILFLPFRLLAGLLGLGLGAAGLLIRGLLPFAGVAFLLVLGLVPLLPFILIGAGLYLVFRGARRPTTVSPS